MNPLPTKQDVVSVWTAEQQDSLGPYLLNTMLQCRQKICLPRHGNWSHCVVSVPKSSELNGLTSEPVHQLQRKDRFSQRWWLFGSLASNCFQPISCTRLEPSCHLSYWISQKKVMLYISTCNKNWLNGNTYPMIWPSTLISIEILVISISY